MSTTRWNFVWSRGGNLLDVSKIAAALVKCRKVLRLPSLRYVEFRNLITFDSQFPLIPSSSSAHDPVKLKVEHQRLAVSYLNWKIWKIKIFGVKFRVCVCGGVKYSCFQILTHYFTLPELPSSDSTVYIFKIASKSVEKILDWS